MKHVLTIYFLFYSYFNDTATSEIFTIAYTLPPPDALPISRHYQGKPRQNKGITRAIPGQYQTLPGHYQADRKSTRMKSIQTHITPIHPVARQQQEKKLHTYRKNTRLTSIHSNSTSIPASSSKQKTTLS